jgi:small subunit ribosomal protein S7
MFEEKGKKYKTHPIDPDPKYQNVVVSKFINHIMKDGKKSLARKILYNAFDKIKKETKGDPIEVFDQALSNVFPNKEVRSKRVGGATYQVPYDVDKKRGTSLAMRWILDAARSGSGSPMEEKLAKEILNASQKQGSAIKKKENMERMAEANRAFAFLAK